MDLYKLYTERWNKILLKNKENEKKKEEDLKANEVIQVGTKREREEQEVIENEVKRLKTDN
jgi:hypothetical protein